MKTLPSSEFHLIHVGLAGHGGSSCGQSLSGTCYSQQASEEKAAKIIALGTHSKSTFVHFSKASTCHVLALKTMTFKPGIFKRCCGDFEHLIMS
jgi:hypothetical protein